MIYTKHFWLNMAQPFENFGARNLKRTQIASKSIDL